MLPSLMFKAKYSYSVGNLRAITNQVQQAFLQAFSVFPSIMKTSDVVGPN